GIVGTGWQACAGQGGAFGCKPQGTISLTSDGGRTWHVLLRTPRPVVAVSVQGVHEQARFDDGETIGSSDGGLHWAPVVVPPATGVGFVVLTTNGGSEVRRLLETTDAGRSWRIVHTWP